MLLLLFYLCFSVSSGAQLSFNCIWERELKLNWFYFGSTNQQISWYLCVWTVFYTCYRPLWDWSTHIWTHPQWSHRSSLPLPSKQSCQCLANAASLSEHNVLSLYAAALNMICVALLWGAPTEGVSECSDSTGCVSSQKTGCITVPLSFSQGCREHWLLKRHFIH